MKTEYYYIIVLVIIALVWYYNTSGEANLDRLASGNLQ